VCEAAEPRFLTSPWRLALLFSAIIFGKKSTVNRAQRREQARQEARRGSGRTGRGRKVAALGSAAALASAGAGAAMVLTADVAGANTPIVVDSLVDNATVDLSTTLRPRAARRGGACS